jgi:hypothetical protein
MKLLKAVVLGLLVAMAASCGICDTVVYQEDFSAPFVQHDWVYNNSGNNNVVGYPGNVGGLTQPWPAKISEDGHELLGYEPSRYYATSFEEFTIGALSGQDPRGWVGSGTIAKVRVLDGGINNFRGIRFRNQSAYRNLDRSMEPGVQYVQCYVKSSSTSGVSYVYAGTQNVANVAAVVKLSNNGKIQALNGNGSGGGTWVDLADYVPINEMGELVWYRITIKLDYSTHKYRAAVQGAYNDTDLGFRDSAAFSSLQAVMFEEAGGSTDFDVDDVYAGNSPYAPGQNLRDYWTDSYNKWCMDYGSPMDIAQRDAYDWMSCSDLLGNPVNTDSDKAPFYKASLPAGWTAAFGPWADQEPQYYGASGRGKMGFTRLKGAYAQQPDNPCLHAWSSQGDMRVVSPNITTGPGVYTLTFRAGVWNLNTADPSKQSLWTDWCSWGYGYTNWCVWDQWNPNQGVLQTLPPFPKSLDWMGISHYWQWPRTPFAASSPHPVGEEPGQWHDFTNTFAFGLCPDELPTTVANKSGRYPGRGYFIGFQVSHTHDQSTGYEWGTILNVDDIVLTKKDPVEIDDARGSPVGTLVEVADLVIANMAITRDTAGNPKYVDVFLEKRDRSAGILLRAYGGSIAQIWDDRNQQYSFQRGDVVRVVGAISKDDPYNSHVYPGHPQPDSDNPVGYISGPVDDSRLPAVVATGEPQVDLKPVAVTNRALAEGSTAAGASAEGMLVTVFGRVNHSTRNYCYVDDGSGLDAGKPQSSSTTKATGVRIDCRALEFDDWFTGCPADGSYVAITGTYATEMNAVDHATVVHVVYPRQAYPPSDFVTIPE